MTSQILKLLATQLSLFLFFFKLTSKKTVNVPIYPLWGEPTGDETGGFPSQGATNAENNSMLLVVMGQANVLL